MRRLGIGSGSVRVAHPRAVTEAAHAWLERLTPTRAEAQTATPKYEVSLPKSWGKIVNFSNGNFLMESSDGTMRIVDLEGKPPEYPKVKVQIRWQ